MNRKAGLVGLPLDAGLGGQMPIQRAMERLIALGYGAYYDAVVRGFGPWEALLDEVAGLVARSRATADPGRPLKVLDVSCGVGTVAARLARDGHTVVGLDGVEHLVTVARNKTRAVHDRVSFYHVDVARGPIPGTGSYDALVSMHTLYWHPDPDAMLEACRRALKPGGHAVFLTYARPAYVARTFRQVREREGVVAAVRALRWLAPTALFEAFRDCEHRYLSEADFHAALGGAGFEVLESRQTFLARLSLLAWARTHGQEAMATQSQVGGHGQAQ